jgi:hypothetical protein
MDKFKRFTSSRNDHDEKTDYPAVPETLRANSFELSNMASVQQARADTAPTYTPYLGLRSRLSQIWVNRWTVLLLLVLVRLVILVAQLKDNVGSAKEKALSACSKVEDVGSAMASMPHYLSLGVNDMAATGIEKAVSAMVTMLDLILQGVQGLIIFFINFLTATYTCLLTALIDGTLGVVASVTEDATDAFNNVIDGATSSIEDIAGGLQNTLNDIVSGVEDSIFGGLLPDIPTIDFSDPINKLKDFDLNTTGFVADVKELQDNVPTFEEVQNATKEAVSIPFNFVRDAVNRTYGAYTFDRDIFPIAQKEKLTFCSDNDTLNGFFQDLFDLIEKSRIAFIVVLVLLAIGVMAPMAWLEIKRWRREQTHAKLVAENKYDPMDVVYIASRPMTSSFGIKFGSRFNGKRQILLRWCFAYATSAPALFVLSLAITGLFSCLCQYILLKAVKDQVPALTEQVGAFADDVVKSINSVSEEWADDANGVIKGLQSDINDDLLGYVANATESVNNTITAFLDTMEEGLETVFNGTILIDPIKTIVHCTIGIRLETVQDGLTWVHDHAQVTLPLFANDTFSLGAKDSISGDGELNTFLASPSSATTDEVSGAVEKVTKWLEDNIVQEALISTGILLVYVIVVLIGVTRTLAAMATRERTRAEGGTRYVNENQHEDNGWNDYDDQFTRYGNETQVQAPQTTGLGMSGGSGEEYGESSRSEKR